MQDRASCRGLHADAPGVKALKSNSARARHDGTLHVPEEPRWIAQTDTDYGGDMQKPSNSFFGNPIDMVEVARTALGMPSMTGTHHGRRVVRRLNAPAEAPSAAALEGMLRAPEETEARA